MTLRSRDFETDQEGKKDVGRSRKQTDREGESGEPASPSLYPVGAGRRGLLHNSLHNPGGWGAPPSFATTVLAPAPTMQSRVGTRSL